MNKITDFRRETLDSLKVKAVDAEGNVTLLNVRELISTPRMPGKGFGYEIEIVVDLPPAARE